jgi:hypothetical protein
VSLGMLVRVIALCNDGLASATEDLALNRPKQDAFY